MNALVAYAVDPDGHRRLLAITLGRLITAVALRTTAVWSERRYLDLSLLEPKEVAKAA